MTKKVENPKPSGRPKLPFSQEIADHICYRIATECVSMKTICQDEGVPSDVTIWGWLADNPAFFSAYTRAKELQQFVAIDETNDIADDGRNDWVKRQHFAGDDESWQVNGEAIARSKLRIENRRWIAARLQMKYFGDRQTVDQKISAGDGLQELLEAVNGKTRSK